MRIVHTRRACAAKAADGFSLVETLVALIVLAIGVLSVSQLFILSQRHSSYGRTETMAVNLAQEIKERLLGEPFDNVKSIFDGADTANEETITTPCQEWRDHVVQQLGSVGGRGVVDVIDNTEDPTVPLGMYRVEIVMSFQDHGRTIEIPNRIMVCKVGI
jgi:type IV pilus modification protein PilV